MTNNYQQDPQGNWTPAQQYKPRGRSKAMFIVLGVLVGIIALAFGGCVALLSGSSTDNSGTDGVVSSEITKTPAPKATTGKDSPPQKLVKGAQVGPFQLRATVRVTKDTLETYTSRVSVKNTSDESQMALFKITLKKGDDIIGTLDCIGGGGNEVKSGAMTTAQCISTDEYVKGWTRIEMEHTGF
jgi:hypothetical protein